MLDAYKQALGSSQRGGRGLISPVTLEMETFVWKKNGKLFFYCNIYETTNSQVSTLI